MPSGSTMKYCVGVERLAGAKQLARELGPDELRAAAAGAVADEHGVADDALRILLRLAERAVVQPQLGQRLAVREPEVADHEVALRRRGIVGRVTGEQRQREQARAKPGAEFHGADDIRPGGN